MQIDQSSYESFLLSYIDGELTETEKREVELYCQVNPDAARELKLLQQTVLVPSLTGFPDKESLYREEEKRRVIGWYLWRAAVVIVLLGGGIFYWYGRPAADGKPDKKEIAVVVAPGNGEEKKSGGKGVAGKLDSTADAATASALTEEDKPASPAETIEETAQVPSAGPQKELSKTGATSATGTQESKTISSEIREVKKVKAYPKNESLVANAANRKKKKELTATGKQITKAAAGNEHPGATNDTISSDNAGDGNTATRAGKENNSNTGNNANSADNPDNDITSTAKRLNVKTAAANGGSQGTPIRVQAPATRKDIAVTTTARAVNVARRGKSEVMDAPSDNDPAADGNDAVSVLHFAKNKGGVGRLFRRLAGSKDEGNLAQNTGEKKVNISVFQFALGK